MEHALKHERTKSQDKKTQLQKLMEFLESEKEALVKERSQGEVCVCSYMRVHVFAPK
jgi:hypothetical protein